MTVTNGPFRGINPHVNSFLQNTPDEWEGFHTLHIAHLVEALDAILPNGYSVGAEKSLMISRIQAQERTDTLTRTRADVLISHNPAIKTPPITPLATTTPTLTLQITDWLEEEERATSVMIYRRRDRDQARIPITRIEVLSPANKPHGSHYRAYLTKRYETLQTGVNLIELDYLHQTEPLLPSLPSYRDNVPNASPYWVMVTEPQPTANDGQTSVYGVGVLDPLPVIRLPLAEGEAMAFDLGVSYQRTIHSTRIYRSAMDYTQPPLNFEAYSSHDQEQIVRVMAQWQAQQNAS